MSDHAVMSLDPADIFDAALIKMKSIHDRKKADYSDPEDRFSNFKEAAEYAGVTVEQTFDVLIGIKQARIKQLSQPGRDVQNEPLIDTHLDRAVYATLAFAWSLLQQYKLHNSGPGQVTPLKGPIKGLTDLPSFPKEWKEER